MPGSSRTTEYLAATKSPVPARLLESQLDAAREERCARTERDRRDVDDHLVEEARVGELADQVSPADDPDVPLARRRDHLRVHRRDVSPRELDRRARDDPQLAGREDPGRDLVGPLPVHRILVGELVVEDPLVRRRAHRKRADAGDELGVVQEALAVLIACEEPLERVVRIGDEAVERRRRVVLREAHVAPRFASLSSHEPTTSDQNSGCARKPTDSYSFCASSVWRPTCWPGTSSSRRRIRAVAMPRLR